MAAAVVVVGAAVAAVAAAVEEEVDESAAFAVAAAVADRNRNLVEAGVVGSIVVEAVQTHLTGRREDSVGSRIAEAHAVVRRRSNCQARHRSRS